MSIQRTFQEIPEGKLTEADQQSISLDLGWSKGLDWQELLHSKRVLIISEAGAGKTYECRTQCQRLWDAGEPAFFLELATLAASDVRAMLGHEEEVRLDAWIASQSDIATFFMDSIDELKLSLGSFEQALKRLAKGISGQLGRARIVITTRPIPFDEQLVRRLLPLPILREIEPSADTFAQIALQGRVSRREEEQKNLPADWRMVALMPFSDAQIAEFSQGQKVVDPQLLLDDLRRRNALEFARRPQDLIELCADWRDHKRIRFHAEQVEANVRVKLKPREDRAEPADLSLDRAIEGASRLALALITTRRLSIRHNAEADVCGEDIALDPGVILHDWTPDERKALLERPLFGFASYGRVRFHHRSVAEYLAAKRIQMLRERGMPTRALKRLIFAETKGKTIVRPSKRPIAGWLALFENLVYETLRDHEPAVLLAEGDPESLTVAQRNEALRSYVEYFGRGGWRGLSVPHIQIHRFSSPELSSEIERLWARGIENEEVRVILLQLIERGRISECADIAYAVAVDPGASCYERLLGIEALSKIDDRRLDSIVSDVACNAPNYSDDIARGVVVELFPKCLSVARLCQILAWVTERDRAVGELSWHLPRLISNANLDSETLIELRDGISRLISAGLKWQNAWSPLRSDRSHLCMALAATCVRGLKDGQPEEWLSASALAFRLGFREGSSRDFIPELVGLFENLSAAQNALLFWEDDKLTQSLHPVLDPWERCCRTFDGPAKIVPDRDWDWIKADLSNVARSPHDRAMLLEVAGRITPMGEERLDHLQNLRALVADLPELQSTIDGWLAPPKRNEEHERLEREWAARRKKEERQEAKYHASWVKFWREVAEHPEVVFAADRSGGTAWNLWRAMRQAGDESRASGWNRRFIENHFGKETADQLRLTLMKIWRDDQPTLVSERPDDAKNAYLVRWQLGLAAIYAEAEDPQWAQKLSHEEALLAARYAALELNGLPLWMDALAKKYPAAIDATLGNELSLELNDKAGQQWHSMLLESICNASEVVIAVFLPRLRNWMIENCSRLDEGENHCGAAQRLAMVAGALRKHGTPEDRDFLRAVAIQCLSENPAPPIEKVWLPLLLRLDARSGLDAFERRIETIEPSARSEAVILFGEIFGDRHDGINLEDPQFTPQLLLRLMRLAYRHVRPADDVRHVGAYTPDERDHAERGRSSIVNTLLNIKGEEGWAAKLEMAADPLCSYFKDRILAVAEERWAAEIDSEIFDDAQAVALDQTGEAPPSTGEAMFAVMVDRLQDLDEELLRDTSPREAWSRIADEKAMRRVIAHELNHLSKGLYKIDQEAVTADEKETDIRLRSISSPHEAVIELKLADERTADDLLTTIENQLVTKYMAAETSRAGCLLVTLARQRTWHHPDAKHVIDFAQLVALLKEEASRVIEKFGGSLRLQVHALDLRPRLQTEVKQGQRRRAK